MNVTIHRPTLVQCLGTVAGHRISFPQVKCCLVLAKRSRTPTAG
jgi:hypothetical protein